MSEALYFIGKISVILGRPLLVFLAFSLFPGASPELAIVFSISAIAIASAPPLHLPMYEYRYQSNISELDRDMLHAISVKYVKSLLVVLFLYSILAASISNIILQARGLAVIPFTLALIFFSCEKIHDEVNRHLLVTKSFILWSVVTLFRNILPLILFILYFMISHKFLLVELASFQIALALIGFSAFSTFVAFLIFLTASHQQIARIASCMQLSDIYNPRLLQRLVPNISHSPFSFFYVKPWISNISNLPVSYSDRLINLALPSEMVAPFFIALTIGSFSTYAYDAFVTTRARQEIISYHKPIKIAKVMPSLIACSSVAILFTLFYKIIPIVGALADFESLFRSIPPYVVIVLLYAGLFNSMSGLLLEWVYWRKMFNATTLLNTIYMILLAVTIFTRDLTLLSTSLSLLLLSIFRFLSVGGVVFLVLRRT